MDTPIKTYETDKKLEELLRIMDEKEQSKIPPQVKLARAIAENAEEARAKEVAQIEAFTGMSWDSMTPLQRGTAKTELHNKRRLEAREVLISNMDQIKERAEAPVTAFNERI